ncbi:MAG: mevalonate kinase [Euryarchaeota archaeon]|nr:mevalonate kinase [Euryarchaeota archaeon]
MVTAKAPGKAILLGEHAVVFGEPAIAVALDLETTVTVDVGGERSQVNERPLNHKAHAYLYEAVKLLWDERGLDIKVESGLPSAGGLGSSAALTVAFVAALSKLRDDFSEEAVARRSYEVESAAQDGRASPTDTSTSTHGGAVLVSKDRGEKFLWRISRGERTWNLHETPCPDITLVVGYTGERGRTADQVAKVARFVEKNALGRDVIKDIGTVTRQGKSALADGDLKRLGALMNRDHDLLHILGVSTPRLDALVEAARPHSFGAKLTGAGGGGCMIALTEKPEETAAAILLRGGEPHIVKVNKAGVTVQ